MRISLWLSVVVIGALFAWGAWQRRWIADDGLIVLRTVRNLLAGNGPVFNAGERVEANTSTVWTYLVTLVAWIGGPLRLEYVALALALTLSVAGIVFVMLGTGRLYAPGLRGRQALLLPAGALVYIAIPPARDFATSGLENGLAMAYLGLLWWMMVCWSQGPRINLRAAREPALNVTTRSFDAALAFLAGLSVLIRPELALIGGVALVMMLVAARGWRRRLLIVVAGGLLPVLYEFPEDIANDSGDPPAWQDSTKWWMVTPNRDRSVTIKRLEDGRGGCEFDEAVRKVLDRCRSPSR